MAASGEEERKEQAEGSAAVCGRELRLTACMLSGRSVTFSLPESSTVAQLCSEIAKRLEVTGGTLQVLLDGKRVAPAGSGGDAEATAGMAASLVEAGLHDGARLQVALSRGVRPMEVPSSFRLSVRSRKACCSSAFIIDYRIEVDIPQSRAQVELWRKNDHDVLTFNTAKGILEGSRQHWMCGSTPFTATLEVCEPLRSLLERRIEGLAPVGSEADRFWLLPEEPAGGNVGDGSSTAATAAGQEGSEPAGRQRRVSPRRRRHSEEEWTSCTPERGSRSDWFRAPSADCTELVVNISLPFMRLLRVLLDPDGRPVRAAVHTVAPNHDEVEEYDVVLKEVAPAAAPEEAAPEAAKEEEQEEPVGTVQKL